MASSSKPSQQLVLYTQQQQQQQVVAPAEHSQASLSKTEQMRRESPSESGSSQGGGGRRAVVVQRVAQADRLHVRDVAGEPVAPVAARMRAHPQEMLEDLKHELRGILARDREELALLQRLVLSRADLSRDVLMGAHRVQLEILVAIKTGIQAFLHQELSVTHSMLVEVFFFKRCRNMACQRRLPADDCPCDLCLSKQGFCNACMCIICTKFDFGVNTCQWIGCDYCSHWAHTDCALRSNRIAMATPKTNNNHSQNHHKNNNNNNNNNYNRMEELSLRCHICSNVNELFGWAKDVFRTCAADWGRERVTKELDYVLRVFRLSEDPKGKQLFWKVQDLLPRLKEGADSSAVCKELQRFFQDLEGEDSNHTEAGDRKAIDPRDACDRIAEVVQEAIAKMEAVAEERAREVKRARIAFETSDMELEEKRRELAEIQMERQQEKQKIEDLETIVKFKQVEADMYQKRADDAQKEAENLQSIIATESEKVEEDYTNRYLKVRLDEADAERRYLFEKMQLSRPLPPSISFKNTYDLQNARSSEAMKQN